MRGTLGKVREAVLTPLETTMVHSGGAGRIPNTKKSNTVRTAVLLGRALQAAGQPDSAAVHYRLTLAASAPCWFGSKRASRPARCAGVHSDP